MEVPLWASLPLIGLQRFSVKKLNAACPGCAHSLTSGVLQCTLAFTICITCCQRTHCQRQQAPGWADQLALSALADGCKQAFTSSGTTATAAIAAGEHRHVARWHTTLQQHITSCLQFCCICACVLCSEICRAWESQLAGGKDHFRPVTGLPISTYFSAYKFQWMRENVPEVGRLLADTQLLHAGWQ